MDYTDKKQVREIEQAFRGGPCIQIIESSGISRQATDVHTMPSVGCALQLDFAAVIRSTAVPLAAEFSRRKLK